ncbi:MAG: PadR family transcriptional regulator [Mycobacterium leprae]
MAKEKDQFVADWEAEERRLKEEYQRRLEELKASRETSEIVGQVLTRGLLPVYVLWLLADRPRNGNEICTEIGNRTGGLWQPSTGGIYPLLRKFEKQGWVEGNWEDPDKRTQRLYRLTEKGIAELESSRQGMKTKMQAAFKVFAIVLGDLFGEVEAGPAE